MFHRFLPRHLSHATVVAYLALFLGLGGGALAATGGFTGSDGRIHGCVNSTGALTVLRPPATSCATGKAMIAWNQKGPRGIQGLRGPQGIQGIQGTQGTQGIQGTQGLQGPKGDPGPGAISIPITHLDNTTSWTRIFDGIQIDAVCTTQQVRLLITSDLAARTIYVSGTKSEDGVLSAISSSNSTSASGSATANLDVIATVQGTWDRIDLGGYYGGTGGCNYWGLLIPGT